MALVTALYCFELHDVTCVSPIGPFCPALLFPFLWLKDATNIYNFFLFLPNNVKKLLIEDGFNNLARTCYKVNVSDARSDYFRIS